MHNQKKGNRKPLLLINTLFVLFLAGLLLVLFNAPEETTSHLPHDPNHEQFHAIASKKEAEKNCGACHDPDGQAPLPENHPPKFRCLFCHKRK
ncbi:hypothetical protein [Desulforhopalus singaporensis]|uniref:Uncharacterized protein n=1 Tax=Desulforhopalus singaporensis TaxID=91360 RepID=A0A1H0QJK9_9BACT|nr:hypothetical protein [Desulforhopalus singaporensis]SDP17494.1 hypothetical protein SAMN05660330_01994 [Desulforhopalus singaporensis]